MTSEPVVFRVDVFNLSRRPIFVREWSGRLACEYRLDAGNPMQFAMGGGRRKSALTHQPRYTRVAGCDESISEGDELTWKGKGCAILTATAQIGPFRIPGILNAKVSIPRTEYFLRGGAGTLYIEYHNELTIEVAASESETTTAQPSNGSGRGDAE